jgi:hypothetical protein
MLVYFHDGLNQACIALACMAWRSLVHACLHACSCKPCVHIVIYMYNIFPAACALCCVFDTRSVHYSHFIDHQPPRPAWMETLHIQLSTDSTDTFTLMISETSSGLRRMNKEPAIHVELHKMTQNASQQTPSHRHIQHHIKQHSRSQEAYYIRGIGWPIGM